MLELLLTYLAIGLVAGVIVGLIGTGSSLVILPALNLLFPYLLPASAPLTHLAVGTCMATIVVSALVVAPTHIRAKTVNWPVVIQLLPAYALGPLLGAYLSHLLPGVWLKLYVAIFIVLAGVQMRYRSRQGSVNLWHWPYWLRLLFAFVIALFSGAAGVAIGLLMVPYLTQVGLNIKQAVASSIVAALVYTLIGSFTYIVTGWQVASLPAHSWGYVYWPAFFGLSLGVVLTGPLVSRWAKRLDHQQMKGLFSYCLILAGAVILLMALWRFN